MYLASEVMDDVTFSFHVETARRALYACDDVTEMRMLSVKMLEMMVYQRKVVQGMLDQHFKGIGMPLPESDQTQENPS